MKILLAILVIPFSIVIPYGLMDYFFEDFFVSISDIAQFWFFWLKILVCLVIMFVLSLFVDKYKDKRKKLIFL